MQRFNGIDSVLGVWCHRHIERNIPREDRRERREDRGKGKGKERGMRKENSWIKQVDWFGLIIVFG